MACARIWAVFTTKMRLAYDERAAPRRARGVAPCAFLVVGERVGELRRVLEAAAVKQAAVTAQCIRDAVPRVILS